MVLKPCGCMAPAPAARRPRPGTDKARGELEMKAPSAFLAADTLIHMHFTCFYGNRHFSPSRSIPEDCCSFWFVTGSSKRGKETHQLFLEGWKARVVPARPASGMSWREPGLHASETAASREKVKTNVYLTNYIKKTITQ